MIIMMSITGLLLIVGIVLINGKGSFLIAGFNSRPQEEKKKYDSIAICKFMGKIMFALSFSMMFGVLGEAYKLKWLITLNFVLFISIMIFNLIYTFKWKRFKK